MNSEPRQYKDVSGNPVTLDWLVRNEPEWAANQIRHRDKIESELAETKARVMVLEGGCNMAIGYIAGSTADPEKSGTYRYLQSVTSAESANK